MDSLRNLTALVGRILLALIFVLSGLNKLMNLSASAVYMMQLGISANVVQPALYVSIAVELGCALLLIAGLQARLAALILFLRLIPVTLLVHVGQYFQDVQQHQVLLASVQYSMALKNIGIMGGLLVLAAMGPGAFSIDGRTSATGTSATRRAA
jgi:putative oxidoreductase